MGNGAAATPGLEHEINYCVLKRETTKIVHCKKYIYIKKVFLP